MNDYSIPMPKTPRERQRAVIWARMFLHSNGLLTDPEDAEVRRRIRWWAEQDCERRQGERRQDG